MKRNNNVFPRDFGFEEKRTLTVSFLEFNIKNYKFELENDPTGLTADEMESIFSGLREQASKVEAMTDTPQNDEALSDAIRELLTILKRGQKEGTCHRLNYYLEQSLPGALFAKLYGFIGIPLEEIVFDREL